MKSRVLLLQRSAVICGITGDTVHDWESHVLTTSYRVQRHVIRRLIDPVEPVALRDLWRRLVNAHRIVDELSSNSKSRSQGKLRLALMFLATHRVLLHSVPHFSHSSRDWLISPEFSKLVVVGESHIKHRTASSIVQFIPGIEADLLSALQKRVVEEARLQRLFNELHLNRLFEPTARRTCKPSTALIVQTLFAIVGELFWFVVKTKATDRTHNNALFPPSDVLILHVLANHAVEMLVTTLLADELCPKDEIKSRWRNYHCSTPEQYKSIPHTVCSMSLTTSATSRSASVAPLLVNAHPLSKYPTIDVPLSTAKPSFNLKRFVLHKSAKCQDLTLSAVPTRRPS